MKLNKLFLAMSVMGASAAMTGCGSSSSGGSDPVPGTDSNPVTRALDTYTINEVCSTVALHSGDEILMEDGSYLPLCELTGTIEEDATLSSDFVYRLNGYVTVGSGSVDLDSAAEVTSTKTNGIKLTVEAGTHFRSSGKGSLIVARGSEIDVQGTAAAPVVMSSKDAGFSGSGEWGGLVLQGFAKNNQCPENSEAVVCNVLDEADTGVHGGNDDADSSGSISHLIIAEGGFEIRTDEEVNGITLHSVGYGTSIENVMVYGNADDGIEFFGGAVNVKNIILIDNNDESLDWDDGFRGNVQFALIRQGVAVEGDHGIEADTAGPANDSLPESAPTIANVTFQEVDTEGADDLFRFKKGTEGTLINIAADNYHECVKAEGSDVSVKLINVVAECDAYETASDNFNFEYLTGGKKVAAATGNNAAVTAEDVLAADNTASASVTMDTGIDGNTIGAATVELGNAFEVTGNNGVLATAPVFTSANASAGFLTSTAYVGAVDPAVTDASNAWWAWAAEVIPAAFQ